MIFIQLILNFISIYPASIHSDEQQHHLLCDRHCHGCVHYIDTTKIRFYGLCDIFWFLFNPFQSLYLFTLNQHTATNISTIFLVIVIFMGVCTILIRRKYGFKVCVVSFGFIGEFTILILRKYGFKICAISFSFYSTHFKFYIHLPCIITQQRAKALFYL